jgi:hypothetical protein
MTDTRSNPYLFGDINLLIAEFTKAIPAQTEFSGIENLPPWLKGLGDNFSYAAFADRLQTVLDEAKGGIETLYSYGTAASGPTGELAGIEGVEFQNTVLTVAAADNAGEAIAAIVADCVPCKDRILDLLSLNPLEELWDIFDAQYQSSIDFILDLYNLLVGDHSVEVFADFCSLFRVLNFQCLPDLYGMIMMLSSLIRKYSMTWKDLKLTLSDILGAMFGPTLSPLLGLMDKYIQLIVAPVECVIDSINAELQKIDVAEAWQLATTGKSDGGTFGAIDTDKVTETVSGPLLTLRKYLKDANEEVEATYAKLRRDIREALGLQNEMDRQMFDLAYHIEMCTRLIGLIQALILAIQQGVIVCGSEETEDFENFMNNYVSTQFDLDIVFEGGKMKTKPKVPEGVEDLVNIIGKLKKTDNVIAERIVSVDNCLYRSSAREIDKVRDLLGTL